MTKRILTILVIFGLFALGFSQGNSPIRLTDPQGSSAATIAGTPLEVGLRTYVQADSWGKTWEDVAAVERDYTQKATAQQGGLDNHSARIHSRTYHRSMEERDAKGKPIPTLAKSFVVHMVFKIQGGKEFWSYGCIKQNELMRGCLVGEQTWVTLNRDMTLSRQILQIWQLTACNECNNDTEGLVYTISPTRVEHPLIMTNQIVTEDTKYLRAAPEKQCPAPCVTNVTYVVNSAVPLQFATSQRSMTSGSFFYSVNSISGACSISTYCPPLDHPIKLPTPPGAGGTHSGPNNPQNYPMQDGSQKRGG